MAIYLYSGTPGSGKSLHLAQDILFYCSRPKNCLVISNFSVDTDKLKYPDRFIYMDNDDMTAENLVNIGLSRLSMWSNYSELEASIILIIDESQLLFNARSWNEKGRSRWIKFFTQHRKLGYKIILVAQFDQMIDKQIRSLIDVQYIHRKFSDIGLLGLFLKVITRSDIFIAVEMFYPLKLRTGSKIYRAHKRHYSLYDTCNLFQEFDTEVLNE